MATKVKKAAAKPAKTYVLVAYKAFDPDLKCRGFQYAVGETYNHSGRVVMCNSGFHSCADPLDVLNYYDITSSRFATVKVGGEIARKDDGDSKICSASITVVAELKLPDFIRAAIKATTDACRASKTKGSITSGHYAKNASSGDSATNASSGDSATNASSGHYAKNASSGHYATNASSGHYATNASSGDSATNASSGDSATNASSGDSATNASSGDSATNEATGEHSVIAGAGHGTMAKGAKGVWISLAEYKLVDCARRCCGFATGQAGYKGVPADTWLIAKGGKLVPA